MKAELQEVMDMLRKLQGAIDFSNAPAAEREDGYADGGVLEEADRVAQLEPHVLLLHALAVDEGAVVAPVNDVDGVVEDRDGGVMWRDVLVDQDLVAVLGRADLCGLSRAQLD